MLRENTHHSLKGERVYLVAFGEVLLCRKVLEVLCDVKTPDKLTSERDDVINVMTLGAV